MCISWNQLINDVFFFGGHATFAFTATAAAAGATSAPVQTVGTPQPGATQATGTAPDSSEPFPWSIVVFALVALGLLVTLGVLARRRLGVRDEPDDEDAGK